MQHPTAVATVEERRPDEVIPRRARRWPPLAVVALVVALPFWGLWRAPGPPMEEGFMLVFPELVLEGMVPNRDFLHLYGPGSLWVLAAFYWLFGTALEVERLVGFAQNLGVIIGVFLLVQPWGRWVAALGAVATAVVILPPIGFTALAWVGGVAFGLFWVLLATRALAAGDGATRNRRLLAAGLLAGAAVLYRPDLAVAVGLSALVVLTRLDAGGRRRLVGALALGVSPYLLHVAMAGPGNVVRGLFLEPVFELRGGRKLPLPPSWDRFDGFLQQAGDLVAPPWPLPAAPSPAQLTLWLVLLFVVDAVLVAAGIAAVRRHRPALLVAAAFSAGLIPQALQRADSTHLAWVTAVPLGLLPAALIELAGRGRRLSGRARVGLALVPALLMLAVIPHFTWRTWGDYVAQSAGIHRDVGVMERNGRIFYYGRRDAIEAVSALLPKVEEVSEPGDRLFVGTGDLRKTAYSEAFLYYLLPELVPATRYIEMDPGVADAPGSGLADDLASADVVILSSIRDDWVEPNDSRLFGSNEPNEVLEREFCLEASFGEGLFGRGLYELYTRCE